MSADVTYAPDRIGYRYGVADDNYSKGYHRGQDVREKGPRGGSVVTQVDAIDDGVMVYVGRPNSLLEATVVIDTGRAEGRFESHSHMADVCVSVGDRVTSGQRLGRNADMDEHPGFIDGPHDHVTITDRVDGAWMTWVGEYDPLPFMQAAYARATAPASPSPNLLEDDIMLMLKINSPAGPHLCSLSTGVFRHFIPDDPTDKIMRLSRIQDDWQDVELSELPALLRTYGCDLAIWDLRGDKFVVLDPLDGTVKSGNMWSAANAARAGVAQVKVTSEQTRAYLAKLTKP